MQERRPRRGGGGFGARAGYNDIVSLGDREIADATAAWARDVLGA